MSTVLHAETFAGDGEGDLSPCLTALLEKHPRRWSRPTVAAASAFTADLSEERWFDVLDELEMAIGEVVPEEMTADRLVSCRVRAPKKSAV